MSRPKILEPLLAHTVTCHTEDDLLAKLKRGEPLRVKLGVDPSSSDLHLGHAVQLRYLRRLQDMGHLPVLIVGYATAMVGDPTGKNATRPQLTRAEVDRNAETYLAQAGLVLDMDRVEVVRNSDWFDTMNFMDAIRLGGSVTVARMLERDTFAKRYKTGVPIGLHEFLYPLMQARDSVEVRADIEIGGTDQTFNLLMGRDFMRDAGMTAQVCITLPLIPGLDGVQKMSKSLGNAIGLTETPTEMFGKTMSVPDELMGDYYRLLTDLPPEQIDELLAGKPRDAKARLAKTLVTWLHDGAAAQEASDEFDRVFRDKGLPDEIPESELPRDLLGESGVWIVTALKTVGLVASSGEARRGIKGGGVRIDGEKVSDEQQQLAPGGSYLLQVGKRRFHRLTVPS
ncbi:MAG: tyrosyl-tRNA synthetase [Pseudohongiellaceae bacterium]|jgi:tyrosyl-tRNA synthetase